MGNASGSEALVLRGAGLQANIKDLMNVAKEQDFYELFGVERYSGDDAPDEFEKKVNKKFREYALKYHPDKASEENRDDHRRVFQFLDEARNILVDQEKRRRYNLELRRAREEEDGWDTFRWWARWSFNFILVGAGTGLIIGGLFCSVPTAGAGLALSVSGSAMLSAGIRGSFAQYRDPDQGNSEYIKEVGIGALAGAAGGAIGAACAGAIAGASCVGAQIGIAAAGGAATGLANHMVEDGVEVACGGKSVEELLTLEHATDVSRSVLIGACAGMAVQGVASAFAASASSKSAEIVDDAVNVTMQSGKHAGGASIKAGAGAAKKIADASIKAGGAAKESVTEVLRSATTVPKFFEGVSQKLLANTSGTAVQVAGEAAYTSAKLYLDGNTSIEDGVRQVTAEAVTSFTIGTALAVTTSIAAQGAEHAKASGLLEDLSKPMGKGHAHERHMGPVEMAEARARVNDKANGKGCGNRDAEGFFTSNSEFESAMTSTDSPNDQVVINRMEKTVGGSVKCKNGEFEYRNCAEVKRVNHQGEMKTLYPVHSGGEDVNRSRLSTPLLRPTPTCPFTVDQSVHAASCAKQRQVTKQDAWTSWASAQESSRRKCFHPRTRFRRSSGQVITASNLKQQGGEELLGLSEDTVTTTSFGLSLHIVTTAEVIRHPPENRSFIAFKTEGMTAPFLVTVDHLILVGDADGQGFSVTEALGLLDQNQAIFNGQQFVKVVEAELIPELVEVIEVKFQKNSDIVLAWMASKRHGTRAHSVEHLVSCRGSQMQAVDLIRGLWPKYEVRNTFFDEVRCHPCMRSLSAGAEPRNPSTSWFSQGSKFHDEEHVERCTICQPHHRHLQDQSNPACQNGIDCPRCHMPHDEIGTRPARRSQLTRL